MAKRILGLHHVTAIAGDPQANMDFYTGTLGLHLVKLTVNYDDPSTYHLYYGDATGRPGSIMTFFPWPGARNGRRGTSQVTVTSFSIPERSLSYWLDRLEEFGVTHDQPVSRFDESVITFFDPDGLQLELVAIAGLESVNPWKDGPVPAQHGIRGFHGVTLSEEGYERTAATLTQTLGFRMIAEQGNRARFGLGRGAPETLVDVLCLPDSSPGIVSVGTVHHIAWRTPNDEEQKRWRQDIFVAGLNVTPVIDRNYFHSIYFREPGGVLFEIATDPPGFAIDEPPERLGTRLSLPPWLESNRPQIERNLTPLLLPEVSVV